VQDVLLSRAKTKPRRKAQAKATVEANACEPSEESKWSAPNWHYPLRGRGLRNRDLKGGLPCKVNVASVNIARHWGTMGKVPASAHFCPERCIMQRQSSRKEPEKKPRKHRRKISYAKSRK